MRILVDGGKRACYGKQGRFRLDTMDAGRFIDNLRRLTPTLEKKEKEYHSAQTGRSRQALLDDLAGKLTDGLRTALEVSAGRSLGLARGYA